MKYILIIAIVFSSCAGQKCYPGKKSKDWATLLEMKKTLRGYRLTWSDSTVTYSDNWKMKVGQCYEKG